MNFFKIDQQLEQFADQTEQECKPYFERIDSICRFNSEKVLCAFTKCRVAGMHLVGTTGYGYDDAGREKIDEVYAEIFQAEDALVRHNFVNGTHALSTALFGVLRPNDLLFSVTGQPYDTLSDVIFGENGGSLKEFGIKYAQVDLKEDGTPDFDGIKNGAAEAKVVYIQRSRGYSLRPSLDIDCIGKIIDCAREVNPSVIVMVDNCYGELCEEREPTQVGADLIVGSLIKNLGGGIAQTGGYIAGRRDLVELCANRLTTVGVGKEVGCTMDQNRGILLGLFNAPAAVGGALKTSIFATALLKKLGYKTYPDYTEKRTDIICAIELGSAEDLCKFCQGIQAGSPVDSFVTPEPWAMPGYDHEVIMAAGAFTMGSSIELSADGPLREPYAAWLQGGLSYETGRIGVLIAVNKLLQK